MTTLEQSLEVLEYKSLDDVTMENLKKSFRRLALEEHPDRGGNGSGFDQLLSSYLYVSGVVRRQTGGRNQAPVLHIDDIQQSRNQQAEDELNCLVSDVYDHLQGTQDREFNERFNQQYEEHREKEDGKGFSSSEERGYKDWLASEEKSMNSFLPDGEFGPFTMAPPTIQEKDLQTLFEYTTRCGKPFVTDLMLLPDQMARRISCGGMSLVSSVTDSFTSDVLEKPEFCDVQDAYTKENTLVDKIPEFKQQMRTFEDLLRERDIVYKSEEDRDLEAISLYEKAYQQQEQEHKKRIESFFASTGASSWALPSGSA